MLLSFPQSQPLQKPAGLFFCFLFPDAPVEQRYHNIFLRGEPRQQMETLEKIFLVRDALITRSVEYGDEIAFYYNYQNHYVRFRFWRTKNVITESEVRIK